MEVRGQVTATLLQGIYWTGGSIGPQSKSEHFRVGNLTCCGLAVSHKGPHPAPQSYLQQPVTLQPVSPVSFSSPGACATATGLFGTRRLCTLTGTWQVLFWAAGVLSHWLCSLHQVGYTAVQDCSTVAAVATGEVPPYTRPAATRSRVRATVVVS